MYKIEMLISHGITKLREEIWDIFKYFEVGVYSKSFGKVLVVVNKHPGQDYPHILIYDFSKFYGYLALLNKDAISIHEHFSLSQSEIEKILTGIPQCMKHQRDESSMVEIGLPYDVAIGVKNPPPNNPRPRRTK